MGHTGAYIINSFFTGSSPPMLGIPLSAPGGDLSKWFIPTYVGHTTPWRSFCPARPVHPHLRGAYPSLHLAAISQNGSSPHTWGIQPPGAHFVRRDRFIPTYVGHTRIKNLLISPRTVHPHIRGAYPQCGHLWHQRSRFIPTYVGHTATVAVMVLMLSGSSPPTWGILQDEVISVGGVRFIPTYVGHTLLPAASCVVPTVHPHIRGAYHRARNGVAHVARFIPTYVGHTGRQSSSPPDNTVHPHIRGAYRISALLDVAILGSSPHT